MSTHKQAALEFLRMVTAGEIREAYRRHVAPGFRHHNIWFAGDADSLMRGMLDNHTRYPSKQLQVHHAVEEGAMVAVHSHVRRQPGDPGAAVMHLFRFDGNRIAELWDMGQAVPEESPNQYGMF